MRVSDHWSRPQWKRWNERRRVSRVSDHESRQYWVDPWSIQLEVPHPQEHCMCLWLPCHPGTTWSRRLFEGCSSSLHASGPGGLHCGDAEGWPPKMWQLEGQVQCAQLDQSQQQLRQVFEGQLILQRGGGAWTEGEGWRQGQGASEKVWTMSNKLTNSWFYSKLCTHLSQRWFRSRRSTSNLSSLRWNRVLLYYWSNV